MPRYLCFTRKWWSFRKGSLFFLDVFASSLALSSLKRLCGSIVCYLPFSQKWLDIVWCLFALEMATGAHLKGIFPLFLANLNKLAAKGGRAVVLKIQEFPNAQFSRQAWQKSSRGIFFLDLERDLSRFERTGCPRNGTWSQQIYSIVVPF